MPEPIKCDGETFLGFTVKACDKPATVHRFNTPHEEYWFCPRHDYFYYHGHYPENEPRDEPTTATDGDDA